MINWSDAAGLVGVALMLGAYAGAQIQRLDPVRPPALIANLAGASLVMVSLIPKFNLSAFIMEAAWAVIAAWGLARVVLRR